MQIKFCVLYNTIYTVSMQFNVLIIDKYVNINNNINKNCNKIDVMYIQFWIDFLLWLSPLNEIESLFYIQINILFRLKMVKVNIKIAVFSVHIFTGKMFWKREKCE